MRNDIIQIMYKLGDVKEINTEKKIVYIDGDKFSRLLKDKKITLNYETGKVSLLGFEVKSYNSTPRIDSFSAKLRKLSEGCSIELDFSMYRKGEFKSKIGAMRVIVHKLWKKEGLRFVVNAKNGKVIITRKHSCDKEAVVLS